jgi:ribonuclease BN (tRNA processing enzyme)
MAERFEIAFLGTGSPLPSPDRCGAGNVVVAGGRHVLVDCGSRAARRPCSGMRHEQIDFDPRRATISPKRHARFGHLEANGP